MKNVFLSSGTRFEEEILEHDTKIIIISKHILFDCYRKRSLKAQSCPV
jgi:hypothetical protein